MSQPVEKRTKTITDIPLTNRRIPLIIDGQLQRFNYDNLNIWKSDYDFVPWKINSMLRDNEGRQVLGVSIGNDKAVATTFHVETGRLVADNERVVTIESEDTGKLYVPFLEGVAKAAQINQIPVGIAVAGVINESQIIHAPDLHEFMQVVKREYDGDFSYFFPTLAAVNTTTQASIKAIALHGDRIHGPKRGIVFISNDDSLNGGVWKDGMIFPMEPGHVPALDTMGVTQGCKKRGGMHVCVEEAGASNKGVENLWLQLADKPSSELSPLEAYKQGHSVATNLYKNSARMTATAIAGMARSVWLMQGDNDTTLALDGNMFHIPSYSSQVMQILHHNLGFEPPFFFTQPYSPTVAAEGAAIAALVNQEKSKHRR